MEWINELLWGEGVGHSILLLSVVIALGIQLGKLKLFGISLGITMVLFVGIFLGHFGFTANPSVVHFFREFGLILFVYSVGMQVGRIFLFVSKGRDHVEYACLRYCFSRGDYCLDYTLYYRHSYTDNGRYLIRSSDEYTGIGRCSTGLFRYDGDLG